MSSERLLSELECKRLNAIWAKFGPREIIDIQYFGNVKAVAVKGSVGDWAAYIGKQDEDDDTVARSGHKLPSKVARAIFDQGLLQCQEYRP
jgi:hypothetical protein